MAPENTLASFTQAIEMGVKQVEFDVCLTKDGVPVVFHDEHIDRCSNGIGKLSDMTLKELQRYDYGSWFDPDFVGESILTLSRLLGLLSVNQVSAQLELKLHQNVSAKTLVRHTLAVISNLNFPLDRVIFSSFSREALKQVVKFGPDYRVAVLFDRPEDNWKDRVDEIRAEAIHFNHKLVNKDFFVGLKDSGCRLRSYTVNNMKIAQQLYNNGVTGFFTDYPELIDCQLLVNRSGIK